MGLCQIASPTILSAMRVPHIDIFGSQDQTVSESDACFLVALRIGIEVYPHLKTNLIQTIKRNLTIKLRFIFNS